MVLGTVVGLRHTKQPVFSRGRRTHRTGVLNSTRVIEMGTDRGLVDVSFQFSFSTSSPVPVRPTFVVQGVRLGAQRVL